MPGLMTKNEACEFLAVSPKALMRMVAARKISIVRLGPKMPRFRRDELDRFVEARTQRALYQPTTIREGRGRRAA